MTTVIFVHGIGGRIHNYPETFETVKAAIHNISETISVIPCLWGDDHGAKYRIGSDGSVSTPRYDKTRQREDLNKYLLWEKLYDNPFYEIRFVSQKQSRARKTLPRAGQPTPSKQLDLSLKRLLDSQRKDIKRLKLISGISEDRFNEAYQEIIKSDFYKQLKGNVSESLEEAYGVLSRLFVAEVIYLLKYSSASICRNAQRRDELVDLCLEILTEEGQERSVVPDWFIKQGLRGLQCTFLDPNRGSLTDVTSPFAGDILVYQANGQRIRKFIKDEIEKEEIEPPVVLLAHSLGGVACVDLLVTHNLPKVTLLITVGSQAPFLYEIGALQSLLPDSTTDQLPPLPTHFFSKDTWLNVYDPKDILSYYAEGAFPGRVTDLEVNNEQHFPPAHSSYWFNSQMWEEIAGRLR